MTIDNTNTRSLSDEEKKEMLMILQAEQAEGIDKSKENYRKIAQAGISQWVRDFKAGNIKLSTVEDLKKLIELDIDLQKHDDI
ncbi:hypothetical protein UP15_12210 [Bacillus pumilus]|uniref:Uncharacterized protein n=1 Tax=Bacillus altitudinis TaxID=293387 RepID=A0A653VAD4_BACAB|nr:MULTISPECIES: hypothetical protein [Bacillus]AMM89712.1 hypothetical protein UP15_12210 [Bacillus pumilus]MCI9885345.1 hypothetical protein [Bacillus altitudinis]MCY7631092.1 hypothetical protein [Bacillus altitudinis]MDH3148862.1 hypothetical protein [Bacillus pumilus]MDM5164153.1 hypothetical protein [Bacillus altitudinis]